MLHFLQYKEWAWGYLAIAAVCEVVWAIGLKKSEGFTRPFETSITVVVMILSFIFLAAAVRYLPVGTAYAIWTGSGAVGVAIIGIVWLHEPANALRLISLALVVVGIVGLKLSAPE
jgi:quaternary ammonium compound-resistance protein SugE